VTDITQFLLSSLFQHKINLSWSIILSKLVKAVVVVLRVSLVEAFNDLLRVSISSVVPKPNVITSFRSLETG